VAGLDHTVLLLPGSSNRSFAPAELSAEAGRCVAAFATLSYYPDNELLDQLGHHAASIITTFRPQATSNTLWAFAKLGYTPCEALLRAAAAQMTIDLTKSVPQDISNG